MLSKGAGIMLYPPLTTWLHRCASACSPPRCSVDFLSQSRKFADASSCVLLRDYIQASLYDPVHGYFSQHRPPVGKLIEGLDFKKLTGELEYKMKLQSLYKELQASWLTPVEIFKPYYGNAIARYLLEHHRHNLRGQGALRIFEVGGGTGTLATNIMDYIRDKAPVLYKDMRYTCIEISNSLAGLQCSAAEEAGHRAHFQSVQGDAADESSWRGGEEQHSFVLMMEVLDNLPHDRIVRSSRTHPWAQTLVCREPQALGGGVQVRERLEEVTDSLIARCIESGVVDTYVKLDSLVERIAAMATGIDKLIWGTAEEVVFVPTRCLALLDTLHNQLPEHTLLAADFDALPDVRIRGYNAPLVSRTRHGRNKDVDTLYVEPGTVDIFFPTNFDALKKLYFHSANTCSKHTGPFVLDAKHVSSQEFMKRFADLVNTTTLSGYNPLLHDYANTRLLIASREREKAKVMVRGIGRTRS